MNTTNSLIAIVLCALLFGPAQFAALAQDTSSVQTIKPISGPGAAPDQHFLLNINVGSKQAVGYFLNEKGLCNLTLMVADAFNGEDVPNLSTVRFDAAIDPGKSARIAPEPGRSLEFTCQADALAMTVAGDSQIASGH